MGNFIYLFLIIQFHVFGVKNIIFLPGFLLCSSKQVQVSRWVDKNMKDYKIYT